MLLNLVQTTESSKDRWVRIADQIPGRVHRQCRDRYDYALYYMRHHSYSCLVHFEANG